MVFHTAEGAVPMTWQGVAQVFVLLAVVGVMGKIFAGYLHRVYEGKHTFMDPVLVPCERAVYRLCGYLTLLYWRFLTAALQQKR